MDTEGFKRKLIAMLSIGIKGYTAAEPKEERRDEIAKNPRSSPTKNLTVRLGLFMR